MKVFSAKNLSTGYNNKKGKIVIHNDLNFEVSKGQFIALVGPNGSGKSTILKTLSKFLSPISGNLFVNGLDIKNINIQDLSKLISIVISDPIQTSEFKVFDLVETGRFPYSTMLSKFSEEDKAIVQKSIDSVGLSGFENRKINTLSDGELQKVLIARALCQQTEIILLDEPTSHLDIENRFSIISLLKKIAHEENKTILFSTHELDLAFQTVDLIWLFDKHRNFSSGTPEDLILLGSFDEIFSHEKLDFQKDMGRFVYKHELKIGVNLIAENDDSHFWTKNALARIGIFISSFEESISIKISQNPLCWEVFENEKRLNSYYSIADLLESCVQLFQNNKE